MPQNTIDYVADHLFPKALDRQELQGRYEDVAKKTVDSIESQIVDGELITTSDVDEAIEEAIAAHLAPADNFGFALIVLMCCPFPSAAWDYEYAPEGLVRHVFNFEQDGGDQAMVSQGPKPADDFPFCEFAEAAFRYDLRQRTQKLPGYKGLP
jgi:hypothetical protein